MTFCLSVLGSGSSGNCTLLRLEDEGVSRHVLIDLGFSPRETGRRLAAHDLAMNDIDDVLLTHLDGDHLNRGWGGHLATNGVRVHVHHGHRHAAVRRGVPVASMEVFTDGFELGAGTAVEGIALAHDQLGTVGFVIEHHGQRLGFATDLGRVPEKLFESFRDLHVLALESNYDRQMQLSSDRPGFLKHRIMGGAGHLSNVQALEAITTIAGQSALSGIVLLHLSRQCNTPEVVTDLYARQAPHLADLLTVTDQVVPTPMLPIVPGAAPTVPVVEVQMGLFGDGRKLSAVSSQPSAPESEADS